MLNYLEIESGKSITASVIWLHGLGANGYDFQDVVPALNLESDVRFIFPHAPEIPVTINHGYIMPAWYDILEMTEERKINPAHLDASVLAVEELIQQEVERGIPTERIVLAGFSQGGAVAYQTAINYPHRLAGLLAMSTYIANPNALGYSKANHEMPILIQHGTYDPVVLEAQGLKAFDHLKAKGYDVKYEHFPMEHHLCEQQIGKIEAWFNQYLTRA